VFVLTRATSYGTQYFLRAGFENPFIITVITNSVNVASTFPGLYLVEKLGRRNLLLLGAIGMSVCQFIVGAVGTATADNVVGEVNRSGQQAAIAFVCIYIYFFASTWGPVAWVVTGELYPLKVRAKCLSMTTASNWLLNFAIAYATPYMVNEGPGYANLQSKVFFVWGSFCFVCIAFVWFLVRLPLPSSPSYFFNIHPLNCRNASKWLTTYILDLRNQGP